MVLLRQFVDHSQCPDTRPRPRSMKLTIRIALVCVSLTLAFCAVAQAAPHVVSIQPQRERINVPANAPVQVTFDEPIDSLSVDPISFRVFGRWSGPASGLRTVHGNTITFTPNEPFFAGE